MAVLHLLGLVLDGADAHGLLDDIAIARRNFIRHGVQEQSPGVGLAHGPDGGRDDLAQQLLVVVGIIPIDRPGLAATSASALGFAHGRRRRLGLVLGPGGGGLHRIAAGPTATPAVVDVALLEDDAQTTLDLGDGVVGDGAGADAAVQYLGQQADVLVLAGQLLVREEEVGRQSAVQVRRSSEDGFSTDVTTCVGVVGSIGSGSMLAMFIDEHVHHRAEELGPVADGVPDGGDGVRRRSPATTDCGTGAGTMQGVWRRAWAAPLAAAAVRLVWLPKPLGRGRTRGALHFHDDPRL